MIKIKKTTKSPYEKIVRELEIKHNKPKTNYIIYSVENGQ